MAPLNPDLRRYVDLTLSDRDPQAIFELALAAAVLQLPGWDPLEGHNETVVLEAQALEVHEVVAAINRLPGAVVMVLLRLYGIERSLGLPATATVRFNLADNAGHLIPAGTVVRLVLGAGLDPLDFATDVDLNVAAGAVTGVVTATADRNVADANGTPAGTALQPLTVPPYVDTIVLETAVAAGADPEGEDAWLDRGVQRFGRLSEVLVLPEAFRVRALEEPGVTRVFVIDNYDPAVGPAPVPGVAGVNYGHVTVAVAGAGGAALSGAAKTVLEASMEAAAAAMLDVHLIDPTITAQAVTATVVRKAGYTSVDVQAAIHARLAEYLSPDGWPWGGTVFRHELISVIDAVPGVERVVSLTVPAADVVLAGAAPLVSYNQGGSVITVNAP